MVVIECDILEYFTVFSLTLSNDELELLGDDPAKALHERMENNFNELRMEQNEE